MISRNENPPTNLSSSVDWLNHLGKPLDTAPKEGPATRFNRKNRPAHEEQRHSTFGDSRAANHAVEANLLDLTGIINCDQLGDDAVKLRVRRHPINVIEIRA